MLIACKCALAQAQPRSNTGVRQRERGQVRLEPNLGSGCNDRPNQPPCARHQPRSFSPSGCARSPYLSNPLKSPRATCRHVCPRRALRDTPLPSPFHDPRPSSIRTRGQTLPREAHLTT
jgi:hypothetical protein